MGQRFYQDMQEVQQMAKRGEIKGPALDAYAWWEMHKLNTQARSLPLA